MANSSENYMQFYHVPQQSRREKLRYSHDEEVLLLSNPNNLLYCTANPNQQQQHQQQQIYLSLSSSTASAAASSMCHQAMPRQQLGPFTGYAEILSRSKFLEPARLLLEDICNVGGVVVNSENVEGLDAFLMEVDREILTGSRMDGRMGSGAAADQQDQAQLEWKETKLVSMLDEVYRRYKLYYQQVQSVIASFESVPGLSSAAPYAAMSFKAMSKHFKCLKNAMLEQLVHINKGTAMKESFLQEESNSGFGQINRFGSNNYNSLRQPHIWRPQRGLPERAVAVLRSWLFDHFLHPYPSDTDKQMLAKQTGLTRNQVSNWFINARVRLWKPMVEEIHSLEVREAAKTDTNQNNNALDKQSHHPSSSTATLFNGGQTSSSKRPHDDMSRTVNPSQIIDQDPSYDNLVTYNSGFNVVPNGGVSLTLGLHHPFGLGLEECSDPYALGSYGGQDRHLLHDFVGEALL